MALCNCKSGNRKVIQIGIWNHCPLKRNAHTNFMVFRCKKCGGIIGFPHENLIIAMEDGTDETKKKLAEIIGN